MEPLNLICRKAHLRFAVRHVRSNAVHLAHFGFEVALDIRFQLCPLFSIAARTRSRDSLSDASGKPTRWYAGTPEPR